ncbi:MAG: Do family serine endopeptidase [Dysgonamonadaceae bacterium]|nr:Do family serine endopeptidase [Dysgonamonadaceae bacterium]
MNMNWKLFFSFLLTGMLSAGIAVGTYSHLNKNNLKAVSANGEFNQTGYQPVAYNLTAAENTDFTLAAEQSVNAVVHIKSVAKPSQRRDNQRYFDPFEFFFGRQSSPYQNQPRVGFGSGVIISTDGYIVTNNHVIEGADELEVTTNDNRKYTAKLIGGDESTDIALLKIEEKNLSVIPFGDSDALKIGEWVLAVGSPFNLTSTVTAGIVSATGRGFSDSYSGSGRNPFGPDQGGIQAEKIQSFIQTDAAVNPGNSGGALVNTRGELIGINTMIYSETGNFVGYSFAVPISLVRKVASDIQQYGVVQRAVLGVTVTELDVLKEIEPEKYEKLKVKDGVYVSGFSTNSSAEKAGMKEGDVIIGMNNHRINNFQELRAQISRYSPGNTVGVEIQRGDEKKIYKVELKNDQGTTEVIKHRSVSDVLGASFQDMTTEAKRKAGVSYGVEVIKVSNGKLKNVGIKDGFIILTVNDNRIDSANSLTKLIESVLKQDPDERVLYIKGFHPNDRVRFFAIDLND